MLQTTLTVNNLSTLSSFFFKGCLLSVVLLWLFNTVYNVLNFAEDFKYRITSQPLSTVFILRTIIAKYERGNFVLNWRNTQQVNSLHNLALHIIKYQRNLVIILSILHEGKKIHIFSIIYVAEKLFYHFWFAITKYSTLFG